MYKIKRNVILSILFILLSLLIFKTFQSNETITIIVSILSLLTLVLYLRNTQEIRLIIAKNRIFLKYRKKELKNSFVVFLEISNLALYSQFYDITLSDKILNQIFRESVKKIGKNRVFLYRTDQIVFILDFKNTTVINQHLRAEEQFRSTRQIMDHIARIKYNINNREEEYEVKMVAGCASVGVKEEIQSIESLVKLAHFSMIKGKETNVDVFVASEETHNLKKDLDNFNLEIEKGFELDQFSPFFFPIIDINTGKIIGCESLVRWQKNEYQVIQASRFIEIAIEKNLFEKIDKRVIEKTLLNFKKWKEEKLVDEDFKITINLGYKSLVTFRATELANLVKSYDIAPNKVEFDISENDILSSEAIHAIVNLKKSNFIVSLDAFSSKSFSLSSIVGLELDTLKIDKASMPKELEGSKEIDFYMHLIKFAKMMNLKVMSKGIENENHFKLAKQLNVDFVQGYYFTPPLDEINFLVFLKKYKDGIQTL